MARVVTTMFLLCSRQPGPADTCLRGPCPESPQRSKGSRAPRFSTHAPEQVGEALCADKPVAAEQPLLLVHLPQHGDGGHFSLRCFHLHAQDDREEVQGVRFVGGHVVRYVSFSSLFFFFSKYVVVGCLIRYSQ